MSEVRGFSNLELISRSLRELFRRLTPAKIRQFAYNFELTPREADPSADPVLRVQRIARRLADHYRISVTAIIVTFRSDMDVPGRVELTRASEFFIELHTDYRHAVIPATAILAHEVAHIFLFQAGIRFGETFENEVLTDTTAAFLGCGATILNAASRSTENSGNVITTHWRHFGYISVDEFGYIQAKRDAYFQLARTNLVNQGLPSWGYDAGRKRFDSELGEPPFAPERLDVRNRSQGDASQETIFTCCYCSQGLRIPRLGKKISVYCPTCNESLVCYPGVATSPSTPPTPSEWLRKILALDRVKGFAIVGGACAAALIVYNIYPNAKIVSAEHGVDKSVKTSKIAGQSERVKEHAMATPEIRIPKAATEEDARTFERYKDAAAKGGAHAEYLLGVMYANGQGTAKDNAKAVELYKRAAAKGDVDAKHVLELYGVSPIAAINRLESNNDYQEKLKLSHLPTDQRLSNGAILADRLRDYSGGGKLTLDNGLPEDAYVKLLLNGQLVAAFYVRSHDRFTYSKIPDGSYSVVYCTGYGWDGTVRNFARGRHACRYDDPLRYSTSQARDVSGVTTYTDVVTLTLHKVANGNAKASDISLEDFDNY